MSETNWYETRRRQAHITDDRAREQGIQVHDLETDVGRVCVTIESGREGDTLFAGRLWSAERPVRVNNRDFHICTSYRYRPVAWRWIRGTTKETYDRPIMAAVFSAADMTSEGGNQATPGANWKAEQAIGAALARLNTVHEGLLPVQGALNAAELAAQHQDYLAKRARERAAEWTEHAARHDLQAERLRRGEQPTEKELQEYRVW